MKRYAARTIRVPDRTHSRGRKVLICLAVILLGLALGVFQKWLDGSAVNELPMLFQRLDLTNFFGRFAVWILLGVLLSVYAASPGQAALRAFLFFFSMVAGYYLYCALVLGFFPRSYAMVWLGLSLVSPFLAYLCWYARGDGLPAILLSAAILGALFSQAFFLTQGFRMTYWPEVIAWAVGLVVLRRRPREFAVVLVLSVAVAFLIQRFLPYWG